MVDGKSLARLFGGVWRNLSSWPGRGAFGEGFDGFFQPVYEESVAGLDDFAAFGRPGEVAVPMNAENEPPIRRRMPPGAGR